MKMKILLLIVTIISNVSFVFPQNSLYTQAALYEHDSNLGAISSGDVFNNGNPVLIVGDNNARLLFFNWENTNLSIIDMLHVPFTNIRQIAVEDIDSDGFNELLVSGDNSSQNQKNFVIYQYLSKFEVEWDITGLYLPTFIVHNLDDEPGKELVICDYEQNQDANLMIFSYSSGTYHLDFSVILLDPHGYASVHHPTVGDFNGNGNFELAVSNDNGYTWLFDFNGEYYQQLKFSRLSRGGAARSIAGNVDNDVQDEMLLGTNAGLIQVLSHTANWDFTEDWSLDVGRLAYNIEIKNIDYDPECEFAVIHSNTNQYYDCQVSVFDNISGNFDMIWFDTPGYGSGNIHMSDLNQDLSIELLITINDNLILYRTKKTTVQKILVAVPNTNALPSDTILIPTNVQFPTNSTFGSAEITFGGYFKLLDFIEVDTSNSLLGTAGWNFQINETDSLLITAFAGAEDIGGEGVLFWLKFAVPDTLLGFVPITLESALFNTGEIPTELHSGGLNVFIPPDISVFPDSLTASLETGNTITQTVTISNSGGSGLTFNTSIDPLTGPDSQNYALEFDGRDDYVAIDIPGSFNQLTIAMWLKYDVACDFNALICPNTPDPPDCIGYLLLRSGNLEFNVIVSSVEYGVSSTTPLASGTWYYVVATYDDPGKMARIYIDGSMSGQSRQTGGAAKIGKAAIGADYGRDRYFDGMIDEVRIWNKIRTQSEIQADMHREISGTEPGLVAYWRFNEGSSTIAFDHTPNGYDGTLHGGVEWITSGAQIFPWISVKPTSGSVPIESSMDIEVTFDATHLSAGDYNTDIIITSNDWDEPEVRIPIHLKVTPTTGVDFTFDGKIEIPKNYVLFQNFPNPFNPVTTIHYELPNESNVILRIYDILGREIQTLINKRQEPGRYTVKFDAKDLTSGIYFYKLQAGSDFLEIKKMLLLR